MARERLHKVLAGLGVASRRACEKLIEEGRVAVNGEVVDSLPAWADAESDRIEVDGRAVSGGGRRRRGGRTYLLVNKPRRVICTSADPEGRTAVTELVPHPQRLFCVGRLDAESTGLVLLTDDGELAHRLMHPKFEVPKTYEVSIRGSLGEEDIEKLRDGIWLADRGPGGERGGGGRRGAGGAGGASGGGPAAEAAPRAGGAVKARAESVSLVSRDREKTRLRITLREGRNREVRRMLARLGHKVRRLERTALGPLRLKGVGPGQWRTLTRAEIAALRKAADRAEKRTVG